MDFVMFPAPSAWKSSGFTTAVDVTAKRADPDIRNSKEAATAKSAVVNKRFLLRIKISARQ